MVPVLLSLPAIVVIAVNVLKYEFGIRLLPDPVRTVLEPQSEAAEGALGMVLFGLTGLAAAITLWRVARVRVRRSESAIEADVTVRIGWPEALSLVLSFGALAILVLLATD
jgi:hypothetical protein